MHTKHVQTQYLYNQWEQQLFYGTVLTYSRMNQ